MKFRKEKTESVGLMVNAKEIFRAIREMPETMRKLGPVQLFTWLGLFCMWLYFPVAVAHNVFGASDPNSPLIQGWRGVGRNLLRSLLAGVFRILVCTAETGVEVWPKEYSQPVPAVRSRGADVGGGDA